MFLRVSRSFRDLLHALSGHSGQVGSELIDGEWYIQCRALFEFRGHLLNSLFEFRGCTLNSLFAFRGYRVNLLFEFRVPPELVI